MHRGWFGQVPPLKLSAYRKLARVDPRDSTGDGASTNQQMRRRGLSHLPVLVSFVGAIAIASPSRAEAPTTAANPVAEWEAETYQIATVVTSMAVYSLGTGSLVGGGVLTAFNAAKSWLLADANNYAWDSLLPARPAVEEPDQGPAEESLWRKAGKYLTFKPVDTALKFGSLYLYTGSLSQSFALGSATSLTSTVVYVVNRLAWGVYSWTDPTPEPVRR